MMLDLDQSFVFMLRGLLRNQSDEAEQFTICR